MLLILFVITGISWNLENFFDWTAQTDGKSDMEFSENGCRHWTRGRFYRKCNAVAKTVLASADEFGAIPDFIAVQEVENAFVVRQLICSTPLSKLGFGFIHFESHDHRGIDCALLYRRDRLRKITAKPCHIFNSDGTVQSTRDILLGVFLTSASDTLAILVNHHPSKVGSSGGEARDLAMARLLALRDSLVDAGIRHIIAAGDFNDSVEILRTSQPPVALQRPPVGGTRGEPLGPTPRGTIKYNGSWEKIDACLGWGVEVEEYIFAFGPLLTQDKSFGGIKPLRTYSGPGYLGGVSDHLPLYLRIKD